MVSTDPGRNKVTATPVRVLALVLVVLLAPGCHPDVSTPRGTAEHFLDLHYVAIDLPAALEVTRGVARGKVEQELALTRGQQIDDTTRKPSVHYKLLEEHPAGDEAMNYVYLGTITVDGADRFERRWMVTVRREDDAWRVTNYQEFEE